MLRTGADELVALTVPVLAFFLLGYLEWNVKKLKRECNGMP